MRRGLIYHVFPLFSLSVVYHVINLRRSYLVSSVRQIVTSSLNDIMPLEGTRNSFSPSVSSVSQLEREIQDAKERLEQKLEAKGRKAKPLLSDPERKANHQPTTRVSRSTSVVVPSIRTLPYFSYLDLGRIKTWVAASNEATKWVRGIQAVIRGMQWIGQRWPERVGSLAGLVVLYINSVAALIIQAGIIGLEVPAAMVCGVPHMWKGH